MAQLQVPISDELMLQAKIFAAQNSTTLKEITALALQAYLANKPQKGNNHVQSE